MKTSLQWILISASCLLVFIGARSVPVESCEFLHYGDYVDDDGVIAGCGYEETNFFDLSELRFPIRFELVPDHPPVAGEPVNFSLSLRTTTGRAIDFKDIAITHTERVHAMVVDETLEDYQHLHPQPAGPSGHFRFQMTPNQTGTYRVYLDFIPLTNSRRTLLSAEFEVARDAPSESAAPMSRSAANAPLISNAGGHRFELALDQAALKTGELIDMELKPLGDPANWPAFELVMGAYSHLVAFDPQRLGFAHLHPKNPIVEGQDPRNPDMRFQLELDQPGDYRIWAQVRIDGEDVFVPFDLSLKS